MVLKISFLCGRAEANLPAIVPFPDQPFFSFPRTGCPGMCTCFLRLRPRQYQDSPKSVNRACLLLERKFLVSSGVGGGRWRDAPVPQQFPPPFIEGFVFVRRWHLAAGARSNGGAATFPGSPSASNMADRRIPSRLCPPYPRQIATHGAPSSPYPFSFLRIQRSKFLIFPGAWGGRKTKLTTRI